VSLRSRVAGERGDTLIEVIISALIVGGIVIATLNGIDEANRSTALSRARFQADALAQQNEDRLRSQPAQHLAELSETETVTENGTKYTITMTGQFHSNSSSETSCTSAASADYIETRSEVTWVGRGGSKPVVETGIVSPPPGTTLLVQVKDSAEPVVGATGVATGPAPATTFYTLNTSSDGCAIFAVSPGEYKVNVKKTGWVTPNGFANSNEDSLYEASSKKFLVAETSASYQVQLAPAGKLEVKFKSSGGTQEGDSFVVVNTAMSKFRQFGTMGTYHASITGENLFPFPNTEKYTVFAGLCPEDSPEKVSSETAPQVEVLPGETSTATVTQAPLKVKVLAGTVAKPGIIGVSGATVRLEDTKCEGMKRSFTTNASGEFANSKNEAYAIPYGNYKLCVAASGKKITTSEFANNTTSGPSALGSFTNGGASGGYAVIDMGSAVESGSCP